MQGPLWTKATGWLVYASKAWENPGPPVWLCSTSPREISGLRSFRVLQLDSSVSTSWNEYAPRSCSSPRDMRDPCALKADYATLCPRTAPLFQPQTEK